MKHTVLFLTLALLAGCASQTDTARTPFVYRASAPAERPGIGTGHGEWRPSAIRPAYFARAAADRPAAVAKLFYNDRDGVDAMLDYLGGEPRPASGLQKCAGGIVRIGLRDGEGHWLDTWESRGHRLATGARGGRYEIVLKNESRRKIEAVVSVDGNDVMDGGPAAYARRGLVIAPRETVAIAGFRAGREGVAAFRFVGVGDTYAQRRYADTRSVGLIGIAVFTERWSGTPAVPDAANRAWRAGGVPSSSAPDA